MPRAGAVGQRLSDCNSTSQSQQRRRLVHSQSDAVLQSKPHYSAFTVRSSVCTPPCASAIPMQDALPALGITQSVSERFADARATHAEHMQHSFPLPRMRRPNSSTSLALERAGVKERMLPPQGPYPAGGLPAISVPRPTSVTASNPSVCHLTGQAALPTVQYPAVFPPPLLTNVQPHGTAPEVVPHGMVPIVGQPM